MKNLFVAISFMLACNVSAQDVQTRVVEEGGNGMYKAVMKEVQGLEAHTVFCPQYVNCLSRQKELLCLACLSSCSNSCKTIISYE